jgi:solute carrier family 45 protein 1/2/4
VHNPILVSKTIWSYVFCVLFKRNSAWLAWFPTLFYSSLYVGELHKRASPVPPGSDPSAILALEAEANRFGSRALFYSSVISLAMNVFLPYFVMEARSDKHLDITRSPSVRKRTCFERVQVHLAGLWTVSHAVFACCMAATLCVVYSFCPGGHFSLTTFVALRQAYLVQQC